jgi:hypothetical protein
MGADHIAHRDIEFMFDKFTDTSVSSGNASASMTTAHCRYDLL